MTVSYSVIRARPGHIPLLPALERRAAALFEEWPVPESVRSASRSLDELRAAEEEGRLWVAVSAEVELVGFALVQILGRGAHLEEVDVLPSHGRRGVGRALVTAVLAWAREQGLAGVTLITYRDIPWNAPFYARLGFRELGSRELTPELARRMREEADHGLDPSRRVALRYDFGTVQGPVGGE